MIYRASEWAKYLAYIVALVAVLLGLNGCNTASKTYDSTTGKKITSVSQDDAVTENISKMFHQCRLEKREEIESDLTEVGLKDTCSALSSATAQNTCIVGKLHQGNMMILAFALQDAIAANTKTATCAEQAARVAEAYFGKESAQAKAWQAVGITALISVPIAAAAVAFTKTTRELGNSQGDTTSTGDIHITKSDDPVSGEGGSSGYIGGQAITIGGGKSASDKAVAIDAEKGIAFTGDSNMDADGAPAGTTGIRLDDADGNGNSGSLF